jgi:hypothetical protein
MPTGEHVRYTLSAQNAKDARNSASSAKAAEKAGAVRRAEWLRWCDRWQNCNQTNPQTAVNKGPMPMHKNLHPLVEQHAAGNSDDSKSRERATIVSTQKITPAQTP